MLAVAAAVVIALSSMVPVDSGPTALTIYPLSGPSAQGPNSAGHTLPQAGRDLVANPPEWLMENFDADDPVFSATLLAERNGTYLYGVLTTDDALYLVAYEGGGTSSGQSGTWEQFAGDGLRLPFASGSAKWTLADGVVWYD